MGKKEQMLNVLAFLSEIQERVSAQPPLEMYLGNISSELKKLNEAIGAGVAKSDSSKLNSINEAIGRVVKKKRVVKKM